MENDEPRRGILTLTESEFILRRELQPEHYSDQRVITFIRSYLMEYSVTIACKDAMITSSRAYQLLKMPDVDQAIKKLEAKSIAGANFKATSLVRRMEEIVDVNIMDFQNDDGTWKPKSELPMSYQRTIKEFKLKREYEIVKDMNGVPTGTKLIKEETLEIKLYDKMKAAELLARDHGIFREVKTTVHELGKSAGAILLGGAEARAEQRVTSMRDITPEKTAVTFSGMPKLED